MIKEPTTKNTSLKYPFTSYENYKIFEIYEAKSNKTEKRNIQICLVQNVNISFSMIQRTSKKKSQKDLEECKNVFKQ